MREYQDAALASLFEELPIISLKTLLKPQASELHALHQALKLQTTPLPVLSFPQANSFHCAAAKQALAQVHQKMISQPADPLLLRLYLEKLSQYEVKIALLEAVQQHDDLAISALTQKLYGPVTVSLEKYHDLITKRLARPRPPTPKQKLKVIDAITFAKLAQERLVALGGQDWIIKIMKRQRLQIAYKRTGAPTLRIPAKLALTAKRAEQVLRHEIDGHARRTINGLNSNYKILGQGLAYYQRTEEGLATHLQKTTRSGLWDGYAASLRHTNNLQTAYQILVQERLRYYQGLGMPQAQQQAENSAWQLLKRTLPGVHNPSPVGAAFFRAHIYFEGKLEVRRALKDNQVTLPDLMLGNLGLQHVTDVKKLLALK